MINFTNYENELLNEDIKTKQARLINNFQNETNPVIKTNIIKEFVLTCRNNPSDFDLLSKVDSNALTYLQYLDKSHNAELNYSISVIFFNNGNYELALDFARSAYFTASVQKRMKAEYALALANAFLMNDEEEIAIYYFAEYIEHVIDKDKNLLSNINSSLYEKAYEKYLNNLREIYNMTIGDLVSIRNNGRRTSLEIIGLAFSNRHLLKENND